LSDGITAVVLPARQHSELCDSASMNALALRRRRDKPDAVKV